MRERYERDQEYHSRQYKQPVQHRREVKRTRSRELGRKISVGILLTTLALLLITVGYAGYWNGGTDLIDHDTATYISLAKYVQQNNVLSPSNPNAVSSDVWWNIQPPGLSIIFSAVAMLGGVDISLNSDLTLLLQGFSAFILMSFVLISFVVVKKITGDTRVAALAAFFAATFSSNPAILGPQYIVPSSFGLLLMYLATYYLYATIKDDTDKPILRSKYTLLGALTITTLILTHRFSTTTFYYIFTVFIILYVLINLGTRMHFKHISVLIVAPLILSAPWWYVMYRNYNSLAWSVPDVITMTAIILGLMVVGVLFSGSADRRSPHNRRDRLFAVIGHTTKNILNLLIILAFLAIIGVVAVAFMFSLQTAMSLGFMISSLGLIPLLSILVYKTTLWDKPETNLRNMMISSWLLVALVSVIIGVLATGVPHMPWLIQRIVPHALQNKGGVRSILYLVLPLSILASLLVFKLAYEDRPRVQGLRRRKDDRITRSALIVAFVVISILSPVFHIATATAFAAHAQDPKLTSGEMSALEWLNAHGSQNDGVLTDPTLMQYVNAFTDKRAVLSSDSENSFVVTHQLSQFTDLSNFMNSSTDPAAKLLIAKKMDVKYFVYDKVKADYSSTQFLFPFTNFTPDTSLMTEVFKNSDVAIYQIDQGKLNTTPQQYASISQVDVNGDSAILHLTNHANDPMSLHIAWQDRYKPVTLNSGETKLVQIDLPRSGSRFDFLPTLGYSSNTLYVSLWMDPPSGNSSTDARYAYPVDAVNINSQQLGPSI